jgi:hypothetical protein
MMNDNVAPVVQPDLSAPQGEKMLPQSQVNNIVASEKERAYQKGLQDAQSQVAPAPATMPQAPAPTIDIDDVVAKATIKMQKEAQGQKAKEEEERKERELQERTTATLQSLQKKLDGIKERIPDWEDTVKKGGLSSVDAIWALADQTENPGETVYELSKSPDKAIMVLTALQNGNVQLANNYMLTLSESLKANQAAKEAPKLNKPLDKITPSNTSGSGGSMSEMSVSDLRKKFASKR